MRAARLPRRTRAAADPKRAAARLRRKSARCCGPSAPDELGEAKTALRAALAAAGGSPVDADVQVRLRELPNCMRPCLPGFAGCVGGGEGCVVTHRRRHCLAYLSHHSPSRVDRRTRPGPQLPYPVCRRITQFPGFDRILSVC